MTGKYKVIMGLEQKKIEIVGNSTQIDQKKYGIIKIKELGKCGGTTVNQKHRTLPKKKLKYSV
jgi:homoserine acetyltransferase